MKAARFFSVRYVLPALYLAVIVWLIADGYQVYSDGERHADAAKATLTFRHFWLQEYNLPVERVMTELIEAFEQRYPQYKIDFEGLDQTIHREQKLKSEMVTGTQPDIMALFGGAEIEPYVRARRLMDLTDWLHETALYERFKDLSLWTFDGRVYGLPMEGNAEPLFYNKHIFAGLSLRPPETIDDLRHAVSVLRDHGYVPFALGNADRWQAGIYAHYLMDMHAGEEPFQRILRGEGDFDHPGYRAAFADLIAFGRMGAFPGNVNQLDAEGAIRLFTSGQAAMYLNGSWDINVFYDEKVPETFRDAVGVLPFPKRHARDERVSLAGGYTFGLGVSANLTEEERQAALLFLSTVYSEETQLRLLYEAMRIPSMNVAYDERRIGAIYAQVVELTEQVDHMFVPYDNMLPPEVSRVFLQVTSLLITGQMTPDEAIRELNAAL
jgi:raffinose/stachyose/melibiose transport system substrate-binding protein